MGTGITDPLPFMHLKDVHRSFTMGEVEVQVLRGVELEIYANELLIILGESGSGKSTLLNMIGGIDQPTSGSVHCNGLNITNLNDHQLTLFRRKEIGFVFQFYNLIPTLTALENVATATEIAENPIPPEEVLELVGLGDRLHHFPSQLSGGQQQRVAIARALAKRPSILLCDEPTGALDHETTVMVLDLLQRINRETGTTMVMITHASAMAKMADRSAVIEDGKVIDIQTIDSPLVPSQIFN